MYAWKEMQFLANQMLQQATKLLGSQAVYFCVCFAYIMEVIVASDV